MTVKDYFTQIRAAEREIQVIRQRQAHYMELATGGAGVGVARRVKGNHHSQVEAAGIALAGLADELEQQAQVYLEMIHGAEDVIRAIEQPRYRQVLELRYLAGKRWSEIAELMGYADLRSVYKVHGWALMEAGKYYTGH